MTYARELLVVVIALLAVAGGLAIARAVTTPCSARPPEPYVATAYEASRTDCPPVAQP